LQTSNLPLQALAANPNLGPTMLGGAQNAGYYTDRFGNIILSPGAVRPTGRAKGGPSSDAELLALLKGDSKDSYAESMKNIDSARGMLESLSESPGETQVEFDATPVSQTVRRATRRPINKQTDRGTAKGMAMELESLTAAQEPRRAPDTLEELLKLSESVRSRDAMSAKDLMRDTFGAEKLTKKQLSRLGDLMTRRFNEGGEAKGVLREQLDELIELAGRGARKAKRGAAEFLKIADIPQRAERESVAAYGLKESGGGKADAMRHLMYQADLTRRIGPRTANVVSRLHEFTSPGQSDEEEAMDLFNDALGREIGELAMTDEDVVRLAREYVDKNKARVLPKGERTGYAKGGAVKQKKP
jgi:hypothetical protein